MKDHQYSEAGFGFEWAIEEVEGEEVERERE